MLERTSTITCFIRWAMRLTLAPRAPTSSFESMPTFWVRSPSATRATTPATAPTRRAMPRATSTDKAAPTAKATSPIQPSRNKVPRKRRKASSRLRTRTTSTCSPMGTRATTRGTPSTSIAPTPLAGTSARARSSAFTEWSEAPCTRPCDKSRDSAPDCRPRKPRKAEPSWLPETRYPTSSAPTLTGRATRRRILPPRRSTRGPASVSVSAGISPAGARPAGLTLLTPPRASSSRSTSTPRAVRCSSATPCSVASSTAALVITDCRKAALATAPVPAASTLPCWKISVSSETCARCRSSSSVRWTSRRREMATAPRLPAMAVNTTSVVKRPMRVASRMTPIPDV